MRILSRKKQLVFWIEKMRRQPLAVIWVRCSTQPPSDYSFPRFIYLLQPEIGFAPASPLFTQANQMIDWNSMFANCRALECTRILVGILKWVWLLYARGPPRFCAVKKYPRRRKIKIPSVDFLYLPAIPCCFGKRWWIDAAEVVMTVALWIAWREGR